MQQSFELIAKTFQGLEEVLAQELIELGANDVQIGRRMVSFSGDQEMMYRANFCLRTAVRVLKPISHFRARNADDVYKAVKEIEWNEFLDLDTSFVVDTTVYSTEFRNSKFVAYKVKDAIVDYFMEREGKRPNISVSNPDLRLNIHIAEESCTLSLDSSGESLHLRGYRTATVDAPINEVLAAALIKMSGWKFDCDLIDPFCGSGTILVEAALMARNIYPGVFRRKFGFENWKDFNPELLSSIFDDDSNERTFEHRIIGFDINLRAVEAAQANAKAAGVADLITVEQREIRNFTQPESPALLITNPPYGERLGTTPALIALYSVFGQRLKNEFGGWNASIFSSESTLLDCLRMRSHRQFKAKNGPLDCVQKNYQISERKESAAENPLEFDRTSTVAVDFANRLQKNIKKIEKWAKQQGLDAYRLYDADLPEYNVAVDRYGDHIVVQEYAAPKNIDENKARQRLLDAVTATLQVTGIETNKLILKVRQKQKGTNQYEKLANKGEYFYVNEYGAQLWVNLTDYLDTGLFLDHRLTRKMVGEMAKGKDFLNLFAYTGSATVHAALGGAKSTTTVDMSNTYLNWAEQNLILNDIEGKQHKLIQADCLQWLEKCDRQFDLIFVDPPTFSNSKRMEDSWDVQRDHIKLMRNLKRILRPNGTIVFSNNKRGFKMDFDALDELGLSAVEISAKTLPLDFERNKQIHNCWLVTMKA